MRGSAGNMLVAPGWLRPGLPGALAGLPALPLAPHPGPDPGAAAELLAGLRPSGPFPGEDARGLLF